jgi:uncharacterized membrane protein YdbT with pleckstrin-like domain
VLASDEEQVCLHARLHGVVLTRPLAFAGALAILGGLLAPRAWPLAVVGALLVAAAATIGLRAVWRWERTHLVVTTEKVFLVRGTLRRRAAAVRLQAVPAIELEQSLIGRVLDYGTVVLGSLELDHVAQPRHLCRLVERLSA